MSNKRASLDLNQFKIELPQQQRDPLDVIIPTAPPPIPSKPITLPQSVPSQMGTPSANLKFKNERSNERTLERTDERSLNRVKVRHTFDIFADQLRDLQTIQLKAVQRGKRKPTLGKMVQQAIDLYLEQKAKRSIKPKNERSNDGTDDGTFGQS
jgi:hypothetical protein